MSHIWSLSLPLIRAGNGTRTRDPNLGKVVLYQLSYSRVTRSIDASGGGDKRCTISFRPSTRAA